MNKAVEMYKRQIDNTKNSVQLDPDFFQLPKEYQSDLARYAEENSKKLVYHTDLIELTSQSDTPMPVEYFHQNCLSWNLHFQKANPDYVIYYNSDHVISLHSSILPPSTYLPLSEYGFQHLTSSFKGLLTSEEEDMLYDYIDSTYVGPSGESRVYARTMYEIVIPESSLKGDVYEFMFDGEIRQIPYSTFRFTAFSKEHALDLLPEDLKPTLIELPG